MKKKLIVFLIVLSLACTLGFPILVTASGPIETESPIPYEMLPNSLSVTIPNIDLSKIRDTRPLFDAQKELLMTKGYSKEEIDLMTVEEFNNIKTTWKLDPKTIEAAKNIYPQLESVDMTEWTHEEFQNYFLKIDAITYAPNTDQLKRLAGRSITLLDARYLLKEFHSYETILAQPDTILISILEKRNQFNLDFANYVSQIGISGITPNATPPPEHIHRYVYINMPGYAYQPDWFHNDSLSWDPWVATWQASKTASAFRAIYNLPSGTPYITNMWGTYSGSTNATHEGIDMVYQQTPPVYSIANGQVRISQNDMVAVYDTTCTYNTIFYYHLSSRSVSYLSNILKNGQIGRQGYGGTGYHLHLQVEYGIDPHRHLPNNHNLDSANPYTFINANGW